ncbi:unnamed protein product [Prunus armeniaca]
MMLKVSCTNHAKVVVEMVVKEVVGVVMKVELVRIAIVEVVEVEEEEVVVVVPMLVSAWWWWWWKSGKLKLW